MSTEQTRAGRAANSGAPASAGLSEHILVFDPSEPGGQGLCRALDQGGAVYRAFPGADELMARLEGTDAGVVLLAEEGLTPPVRDRLIATLESQPPWSDLPLVVVASRDPRRRVEPRAVDELGAVSNLTWLEPLVPPGTLAAALASRLRARRRQYEVRDAMDREQAARQEAERARALQDRLLAQLCHELQTPVSAILLWSRLLSTGTVPVSGLSQAVASIESSARAQSYLISTLLDASQMIASRLQVNLQPTSLVPALETAVMAVRPLADAKKVRLEVAVDPAAGPARADADRIQRFLWSLLVRAIEVTPPGELVSLRLSRDEAGLRIEVADSGQSDQRELWPDRFEPLNSGALSLRLNELGLAMGRQLLELHGGTVEATGRGSRAGAVVAVWLPAPGPTGESCGAMG